MNFLFYNTNTNIVSVLPETVVLPSGLTRTDSTTYTDEELQEWGYVLVSNPPSVQNDETAEFNKDTMQWDIVKRPHEAKWEEVRRDQFRRLSETDWYIIRFIERQIAVPEEITTYRKNLRDVTDQENPFFIQWPQRPSIMPPGQ